MERTGFIYLWNQIQKGKWIQTMLLCSFLHRCHYPAPDIRLESASYKSLHHAEAIEDGGLDMLSSICCLIYPKQRDQWIFFETSVTTCHTLRWLASCKLRGSRSHQSQTGLSVWALKFVWQLMVTEGFHDSTPPKVYHHLLAVTLPKHDSVPPALNDHSHRSFGFPKAKLSQHWNFSEVMCQAKRSPGVRPFRVLSQSSCLRWPEHTSLFTEPFFSEWKFG